MEESSPINRALAIAWRSWIRWSLLVWSSFPSGARGTDHFLTIGGGYEPASNQASMEANVLFFERLLKSEHRSPFEHRVFFADGSDKGDDVQVLASKKPTHSPALELLQRVFDLDRDRFAYRNHRVASVDGPIDPSAVRSGFDALARNLKPDDRLLIYVTAHGSAAKGNDPYNTSITCWDRRPLTMKRFAQWLDDIPESVPVILVMAQCYCGGFAHAIFADGDPQEGMAGGQRVGFFAQRHDLPAAGCRPDIENDEEYSSYFWGAFLGRSRNGSVFEKVDCDGDGRVSFAEAHAHAMIASPTIDIPLKASDLFLRHFSRIDGYDNESQGRSSSDRRRESSSESSSTKLEGMQGSLARIASLAEPDQAHILRSLAAKLDFPLESDVTQVFVRSEEQRDVLREARRGSGRRGRFSRRREYRNQILQRWPELEMIEEWKNFKPLKPANREEFLMELQSLPGYAGFEQSQTERQERIEKTTAAELKEVLYRRLIHTLETILYAHNLPQAAPRDLVDRYRSMRAVESMSLKE